LYAQIPIRVDQVVQRSDPRVELVHVNHLLRHNDGHRAR